MRKGLLFLVLWCGLQAAEASSGPSNHKHALLLQGNAQQYPYEKLLKKGFSFIQSRDTAVQEIANAFFAMQGDSMQEEFWGWGSFFLGEYYLFTNRWDSAVQVLHRAHDYFSAAQLPVEKARAAYALADVYYNQDNYDTAMRFANEALAVFEAKEMVPQQAAVKSLLCDILTYMGFYDQAMDDCVAALQLQDKAGVTNGREATLNTMGKIYQELGSLEKATSYYEQALTIAKSQHEAYAQATALSNLGNIYLLRNQPQKAYGLFTEAIQLDKAQQDSVGIAYSYYDIGKALNALDKPDEATLYLEKGLQIAQKIKMPELEANILLGLGHRKATEGQYIEAIRVTKEGLAIAQRVGAAPILKTAYQNLAQLYDLKGDKEYALIYLKLFIMQSEKMLKEESARSIAEQESLYQIKQKEKEIALLKQQNKIQELEGARQRLASIVMGGGLVLFLIVVLVLWGRYRLKIKTNKVLRSQNKSIQEQNHEIETQRDFIAEKRKELEEKNLLLTDSIMYARKIQESLLPEKAQFKKLFPRSFIYYVARDIVSGDFYWFTQSGDKLVLAVLDCTGHGVPGAFMTVLTNSLLNQIILENGIDSPELVLTLLDQKIKQQLHQETNLSQMEGLDIGLCVIDPKKREIAFAGAKIPLYYFDEEQKLQIIKPDRLSVGSGQVKEKSFHKQQISIYPGMPLYLSTDGYQDQFGGDKDKKYMKSHFKQLLRKLHKEDMEQQQKLLHDNFVKWRQMTPQTDDVLVIGIRLS